MYLSPEVAAVKPLALNSVCPVQNTIVPHLYQEISFWLEQLLAVRPQYDCSGKAAKGILRHFLLFQPTWLHAYLGLPMKEAFLWCFGLGQLMLH